MKQKKLYCYLLAITSFVILSQSCSVQNRRYTKGFYIDRINSHHSDKTVASTYSKKKISVVESDQTPVLSCSIKEELSLIDIKPVPETISEKKCDTIHLRDGSIRIIEIYKIDNNKLYYYDCANSRDLFDIPVSQLASINYSDGRVIGRTIPSDKPKDSASSDQSEEESNLPIDKAKRSYGGALFLLLLNLLLSILLFSGALPLFLLIIPLLILELVLTVRAKKKATQAGDDKLYRRANTVLVLTVVLLIATTFFFGITVSYIWNHWVFVP